MGLYKNNNGTLELIAGRGADTAKSIATIEETLTASKAYAAGEYIFVRAADTMYRATTAIVSGAALVVGTNIAKTTVGEELSSANSNFSNYSIQFLHRRYVDNWDDVKSAGWYTGSNATNAPTSGWVSAICIPANNDPKYSMVIATAIGTGSLYCRRCNGGTWGTWRAI